MGKQMKSKYKVGDREGLLSCIVPTLNESETISDFITSLYGQDYRPIELLIVDGGSKDGTLELISQQISALNDSQFIIKVFIEDDFGELSSPANARNIGIDHSVGEYLLIIDSDTVMHNSSTLSRAISSMTSNYILIPFELIQETRIAQRVAKLIDAGFVLLCKRELIGSRRFDPVLGFGEDRVFHILICTPFNHTLDTTISSIPIKRYIPTTLKDIKSQNKWYGRTILRYMKVIYGLDKYEFFIECLYILLNIHLALTPILIFISLFISPVLSLILIFLMITSIVIRSRFRLKSFSDFIFATCYYLYCSHYFTNGLLSSLYIKNKAGRY